MTAPVTRRRAIVFAGSLVTMAVLAEAVRPRHVDHARATVPLETIFPRQFGAWRIDETMQAFVRPADEAGKLYGVYDQVLERAYLNADGERVMLSAAYGSEQSPALQVHRPEICYAASGFRIADRRSARIDLPQRRLPVTQLLASLPGRSEPITYWTVVGDTVAEDSGQFRWLQLRSGFGGALRDGMLVRISTIQHDAEAAWRLQSQFAADLLRALRPEHRDRVFGAASA